MTNTAVETTSIMKYKDIVSNIRNAIKNNKKISFTIYNDGCWWIDIEMHPSSHIRFWAGYEDKRTFNTNGSICVIYDNMNEELINCVADFKLKQTVRNKIINTVRALKKEGLYQ